MRVGPMTPMTPTTSLSALYGAVTMLHVVEDAEAGLLADENLHAVGPQAVIEQVQDVALLVERLEQAPQLVDRRQLAGAHEIGFAGDDVLHAIRFIGLEHVLGDVDGVLHQRVHAFARFVHLAQDFLAHLRERLAAATLGQEIGRASQLVGRVIALELDDAVLHFAVVEYQHDERAVVRKPDELDLRDRRLLRPRQRNHAGQTRHVRQQLRRRGDQRLGIIARGIELRRSSANAGSSSKGARALSSESTKNRYPLSVGTRPAEVCGELTKPSCSRSATMLRMVAEDKASPDSRDSARDPTG